MELWQQIVALILTPTMIVGALAYLISKLFDRGLQRDLEKFKSELDVKRFEHQTKFSLVHEKRAEVIANLYSRLMKARRLMAQLTAVIQWGDQSLTEKKKRAADACNDANDYFNEHRIYLNNGTGAKVEAILEKMNSAFIDFDTAQPGTEYRPDPSGLWMQANKQIKDEFPPLLEELENQFCQVLASSPEGA